jgi:hypothetical protein
MRIAIVLVLVIALLLVSILLYSASAETVRNVRANYLPAELTDLASMPARQAGTPEPVHIGPVPEIEGPGIISGMTPMGTNLWEAVVEIPTPTP